LTEVEGIGEKTAQKLLKHFGAVKNIKSANRDEVEKIAGKKVAEKLYEYFAGQEK
jgi:excinuclease ABC subunit C